LVVFCCKFVLVVISLSTNELMQVKMDMTFEQLVDVVKKLPAAQLKKLKAVIENEAEKQQSNTDFAALLRNGPTATKEQIKTIENNRKLLLKWR
jgi:hypothetical protein